MTLKQRYDTVLALLEEANPDPTTELHYGSPFQLLVAVILSAQCTDKRVNMVTPALFEAFPDARTMAAADADSIFPYIKSVSYPNNKTKSLLGMARRLVEEFDGEVPPTLDEMMTLPGVGRKTANVMLAVHFGKAAMPVDTHVFRVSHRIGLVSAAAKTPLLTEKALNRHIDPQRLANAHHWLILHGRYVCKARKPLCQECPLTMCCRYFSKL